MSPEPIDVAPKRLSFEGAWEHESSIIGRLALRIQANVFLHGPVKLVPHKLVFTRSEATFRPVLEGAQGALLIPCWTVDPTEKKKSQVPSKVYVREGADVQQTKFELPFRLGDIVILHSGMEYSVDVPTGSYAIILHLDIYVECASVSRSRTLATAPFQRYLFRPDARPTHQSGLQYAQMPSYACAGFLEEFLNTSVSLLRGFSIGRRDLEDDSDYESDESDESSDGSSSASTSDADEDMDVEMILDDDVELLRPTHYEELLSEPIELEDTPKTIAFQLAHLYPDTVLTPECLKGADIAVYEACKTAAPDMHVDLVHVSMQQRRRRGKPFNGIYHIEIAGPPFFAEEGEQRYEEPMIFLESGGETKQIEDGDSEYYASGASGDEDTEEDPEDARKNGPIFHASAIVLTRRTEDV